MPRVFIPALLRAVTGGCAEVEAVGATVREILADLETQFPGLQERLLDQGRLRHGVSVAIDGEITPMGLIEHVAAGSEVHFVTAIRGG